jgi:predicted PurR-regulated permease PerM
MHVAVDSLIAFCATVFLLWIFGAPLWLMILLAWLLGFAAAPFTRRFEAAQLAERNAGT